jgi:hypothetical protein
MFLKITPALEKTVFCISVLCGLSKNFLEKNKKFWSHRTKNCSSGNSIQKNVVFILVLTQL